MIWKLALPLGKSENGCRIISLDYYSEKPGTELLWDRFKVNKRKKGSFATTQDVFDIGMSAACVESRECFLKAFEHIIPLRKGIVRYEERTIIFIQDRWGSEWYGATYDAVADRHQNPLPAWLNSIKRLAFHDFNYRRRLPDFAQIILAFKNLEWLVEVVDLFYDGTTFRNYLHDIGGRSSAAWMKLALRNYKILSSTTNPDYKVPNIISSVRLLVEGREVSLRQLNEDRISQFLGIEFTFGW
jgi:hypothetical protein